MNKQDIIQSRKALLDASRQETEPYFHKVLGENFIVLPEVFSPKYFYGTEFFAKSVMKRKLAPNSRWKYSFLEIGAGTGAISCLARLQHNNLIVNATDINPESVRNIRLNAMLKGIKIDNIQQGDVYESTFSSYHYDTIFWNVPFCNVEAEPDMLEKAVIDPKYESLARFIQGAEDHLTPEGKLLIGFSKDVGDYEVLERLVNEAGFPPLTVVAESEPIDEGNVGIPIRYQLLETKLK